MKKLSMLVMVSWVVAVSALQAQFSQYTPPGGGGEELGLKRAELEDAIGDARWRLGRLYVQPWLGLQNIAWVDDGQDQDEDVTATAGAGLRAYLPLGGSLILAAHALPEYVWWRELEDRRRINGRYGGGVFSAAGRLRAEATATRVDQVEVLNREVEDQVNTRDDRASLRADLRIGRGLSLLASGTFSEVRLLDDGDDGAPDSRLVDRDEDVFREELRYRFGSGLRLGVGLEQSRVAFLDDGRALSNEGTSPFVTLHFESGRTALQMDLVSRDLKARDESQFPAYEELTGRFRASWRALAPVEFELYGGRNLVYSVSEEYAYFEDESIGLGTRTSVGRRVNVRFFLEEGRSVFSAFSGGEGLRRDDFNTFGAEVRMKFGPATVTVGGSATSYDSSLPEFDRTVTMLHSRIGFGSLTPWT